MAPIFYTLQSALFRFIDNSYPRLLIRANIIDMLRSMPPQVSFLRFVEYFGRVHDHLRSDGSAFPLNCALPRSSIKRSEEPEPFILSGYDGNGFSRGSVVLRDQRTALVRSLAVSVPSGSDIGVNVTGDPRRIL